MRREDFQEWMDRARSVDIAQAAARLPNLKLKRVGNELVGPCPVCGGKDRFAINVRKQKFICRGSSGGNVVTMAMHVLGADLRSACEFLAGLPPDGRPESAEDRRRREMEMERQRAAAALREQQRERDEARQRQKKRSKAREMWEAAGPLIGTPGERYLRRRGIQGDLTIPSLRYAETKHPFAEIVLPTIVCAVQGSDLRLKGVWRIFVTLDGAKARVDPQKMGLGPCVGGAVWFGRPEGEINVGEGVETMLGVRCLLGGQKTTCSAMSTAGVENFDPPLAVTKIIIWPDGDTAQIRNEKLRPSPGLTAAKKAEARLKAAGRDAIVQPTPTTGRDYLDVWNAVRLAR